MQADIHPATKAVAGVLRVTEIFLSLQGETRSVGLPTVFVRLTGCPLRCGYCDTAYAFHGGERMGIEAVVERVADAGVRHVTITGGEPLAQPASLELTRALCDLGYAVSIETSGALDISAIDPRVARIVDMKTPGSGECARNRLENLALLGSLDQVKFVICDAADYDWSVDFVRTHKLAQRCEVLFSPVTPGLAPRTLADWIVRDRLPVRFQIQLHKFLWGDERGR
ncbi:MAG: 7-carboxy-7-deazaguanine synthase QueE [Chromatiales bacterium]|nr:7-carboxy-7-deazaguanine synthase QueE [Chromatiales bacterium]